VSALHPIAAVKKEWRCSREADISCADLPGCNEWIAVV
jgi:hypothetical protein